MSKNLWKTLSSNTIIINLKFEGERRENKIFHMAIYEWHCITRLLDFGASRIAMITNGTETSLFLYRRNFQQKPWDYRTQWIIYLFNQFKSNEGKVLLKDWWSKITSLHKNMCELCDMCKSTNDFFFLADNSNWGQH